MTGRHDVVRRRLTRRHVELLYLLSLGLEYEEMARKLYVSYSTVQTTVNQLYRRLDARNGREAVRLGYELGYLKIGETIEVRPARTARLVDDDENEA